MTMPATPTITPEAAPTPAEVKSADLFFDSNKRPDPTVPSSATPGASEATPEATPPVAAELEPEKPEGEVDDPTKWFIPGKYKTQEDAIKNQENRMGGIANQLDQILKKIDQTGKLANPVDTGKVDVNPETHQPYTQEEIKQQWSDYFQTSPVEAQLAWDKMMGEKTTSDITNQVIRNITWAAFLSSNADMNTPDKIREIQTILQNIPFLANKPDALLQAKGIALAPGENLEEKFTSYLLSKKDGKPTVPLTPSSPQLPGQQGIVKGGTAVKNDPFFNTKSGGSIFNYRG